MTDDMMSFPTLVEKRSDADLLCEMISLRMMPESITPPVTTAKPKPRPTSGADGL
ncbi:hypothetical protein [Mesorhizobium sp.]|uniref:hypothetical protein n=1 Tax=Mesorhizobium sp. TaxID=1871066 RepID=UPI0025C366C2|nr:hypothetical protein [Mesorhizobium sp.]